MASDKKPQPEVGTFNIYLRRDEVPVIFFLTVVPVTWLTGFLAKIFFWMKPTITVEIDEKLAFQGKNKTILLEKELARGQHTLVWWINKPNWSVRQLHASENA